MLRNILYNLLIRRKIWKASVDEERNFVTQNRWFTDVHGNWINLFMITKSVSFFARNILLFCKHKISWWFCTNLSIFSVVDEDLKQKREQDKGISINWSIKTSA